MSLVKASETPIHEAGRCAIRGQCGKKSLFGGNLPCVDNGLAKDADASSRQKLVSLCGDKWSNTPVCCDEEQVRPSFLVHSLLCAMFKLDLTVDRNINSSTRLAPI